MDKKAQARTEFSQGYSCAQAVLRAFAEELGLASDLATRVAGAYGGGIARSGRICGAVTGALMVIGLRYASTNPVDADAKEGTYTMVRRFLELFEEKYGAVDCPGLLGVQIGTPEGMQQARSEAMFKMRCPMYVESAVEMVMQLTER